MTHVGGPDYVVRAAREGDLEALRSIEWAAAQLFLATAHPGIAEEEPDTLETLRGWLVRGAVLVAADDLDRPVGFAIVFALDEDACLHEIDVHPEHGRRGVGTLLVGAARRWAEAAGFPRLVLTTFVDVAWNAPFYRRLGFVELAEGDLTEGLREYRRREADAGLDVSRRVAMGLATGVRH